MPAPLWAPGLTVCLPGCLPTFLPCSLHLATQSGSQSDNALSEFLEPLTGKGPQRASMGLTGLWPPAGLGGCRPGFCSKSLGSLLPLKTNFKPSSFQNFSRAAMTKVIGMNTICQGGKGSEEGGAQGACRWGLRSRTAPPEATPRAEGGRNWEESRAAGRPRRRDAPARMLCGAQRGPSALEHLEVRTERAGRLGHTPSS